MRKWILIGGLIVAGFACGEAVGGVMHDAGTMLADAGDMIADAGDTIADGSVPPTMAQEVSCSRSETGPFSTDGSQTQRWAEFEIDVGQTEVTVCRAGTASSVGPSKRDNCWRSKANWIRGTSTGIVWCGIDYFDADGMRIGESPDPISITVHR